MAQRETQVQHQATWCTPTQHLSTNTHSSATHQHPTISQNRKPYKSHLLGATPLHPLHDSRSTLHHSDLLREYLRQHPLTTLCFFIFGYEYKKKYKLVTCEIITESKSNGYHRGTHFNFYSPISHFRLVSMGKICSILRSIALWTGTLAVWKIRRACSPPCLDSWAATSINAMTRVVLMNSCTSPASMTWDVLLRTLSFCHSLLLACVALTIK